MSGAAAAIATSIAASMGASAIGAVGKKIAKAIRKGKGKLKKPKEVADKAVKAAEYIKNNGIQAPKAVEDVYGGVKRSLKTGGGGGGGGTKWGTDKGAVNMVKQGKVKEHGAQAGAYIPGSFAGDKKAAYASNLSSHAQKKLLQAPRALSYSSEASMKTRK